VAENTHQRSDTLQLVRFEPDHANLSFHSISFSAFSGKIRKLPTVSDKWFVSRFLKDAEQILEAAGVAVDPEISILIHARGGIHLVAGKGDWPLESLLAESGAAAAYRVSRIAGQVLVEGRSKSETCLLRKKMSGALLRNLCPESRMYEVVDQAQCGSAARMLLT